MHLNLLALAVPFFISFMLLEYFIAKKKRLPYYNLNNAIANVSVGVAERLCDVLVTGAFFFVYDYIQKHYGLFTIKPGIFLWILLLLLTDLIWYWYHRLAHEINLFWFVHIVHHQSEDYNYTTSARITVLQALVRTGFWSVLPLIGFPATMITSLLLVHGLYPFFVHTRLIGKLGILEYILVTPSHHRVHHASNEKYLDKNYGDVFIIWDKIFGTFQKEEEEPTYGLTKPLKTYSFLWQHFHFGVELVLAVKKQKGLCNKVKVVFARPDTLNENLRAEAEAIFSVKQNPEAMDKPLHRYVIWQMVMVLFFLGVFILFEHYLSVTFKTAFALSIILTLINCGAIMEQKRWVFLVEVLRFAVLLFLIPFYSLALWQIKLFVITIISVLLIAYYGTIKRSYLQYVYRKF